MSRLSSLMVAAAVVLAGCSQTLLIEAHIADETGLLSVGLTEAQLPNQIESGLRLVLAEEGCDNVGEELVIGYETEEELQTQIKDGLLTEPCDWTGWHFCGAVSADAVDNWFSIINASEPLVEGAQPFSEYLPDGTCVWGFIHDFADTATEEHDLPHLLAYIGADTDTSPFTRTSDEGWQFALPLDALPTELGLGGASFDFTLRVRLPETITSTNGQLVGGEGANGEIAEWRELPAGGVEADSGAFTLCAVSAPSAIPIDSRQIVGHDFGSECPALVGGVSAALPPDLAAIDDTAADTDTDVETASGDETDSGIDSEWIFGVSAVIVLLAAFLAFLYWMRKGHEKAAKKDREAQQL